MINSLCAHCMHTEEVKYDGFLCDMTGYLENKDITDRCSAFEPDAFTDMAKIREARKMDGGFDDGD